MDGEPTSDFARLFLASGDPVPKRVAIRIAEYDQDIAAFAADRTDEYTGESARHYWEEWAVDKRADHEALASDANDSQISRQCRERLKAMLRTRLAHAHLAATYWWMRRAEQLHIDSSAFWEESRYCRELIGSDDDFAESNADAGLWPDSLGQARYALPVEVQRAIAAGESLMARVLVLLGNTQFTDRPVKPLKLGEHWSKELRLSEAAERCGVRESTVREWANKPDGPVRRLRNGWYSVDESRYPPPNGH